MKKKEIVEVLSRYRMIGFIKLFYNIVITKFLCIDGRLIRTPVYIRGKKFINFGKNLTTGVALRLDAFPIENRKKGSIIEFGENVEVNDYVHIGAINSIRIGNNVLIASKVFITDHNHGFYGYNGIHISPIIHPRERKLSSSPVIIEDDVWIGEFSCVLPGVTIGKGAIVGAMSLVNNNIPSFSIAVGIPAKVIKRYDFDKKEWIRI